MRIGIDIDDTTVITLDSMIKYGRIYNEEILKREHVVLNMGKIKNRYYLTSLFGWNEETKFDFFNKYYKNVLEDCKPLPNSPEIINKLKEEGNDIYFISARLTSILDCNAEELTIDNFKKHNIPYDKLIIGAYNKLDYCKDNNIDVFIDDSIEVLEELSKNGIKCYLMTSKINEYVDNGNIKRVYSWQELYNELKEVSK